MKNFKQFSEELNEAVSTGYKEPVDLGGRVGKTCSQ